MAGLPHQQPRRDLAIALASAALLATACSPTDDKAIKTPPPRADDTPAHKAPPQPNKPETAEPKPMNEPKMTWSIDRADGELKLSYQVDNTLDSPIWICDQIVVARARDDFSTTDRLIVKNLREAPGTVEIALGPVASDRPATAMISPTYRPVAAGDSYRGTRTIGLPLASWHPLGGTDAIDAGAKSIRFTLFWFKDEPEWRELPSKAGKAIRVPEAPLLYSLDDTRPMP